MCVLFWSVLLQLYLCEMRTCVVVVASVSLLHSIHCMNIPHNRKLIQSPIDEHVAYLQLVAARNSAAVKICLHVFW